MHREHVDDVGPVVAVLVAVAQQLRGDRVADQDVVECSRARPMKAGNEVRQARAVPGSRGVDDLVIRKPAPAFPSCVSAQCLLSVG
jgi:hypothetical protein